MEVTTIEIDSDIINKIKVALENRNIVEIVNLGWIYLTELPAITNPETGAVLFDIPMPIPVFAPVGNDGKFRGSHASFFESQNIPTIKIDIPEIQDILNTSGKYSLVDLEGKIIINIGIVNGEAQKQIYFNLGKDAKNIVKGMTPFISEELDWNDLETPEDDDNPSPRVKSLHLIK